MDVRIVAQGRDYQGVPFEQIRRAVAQGRISGQDLVRLAGSPAWTAIADVPELRELLPDSAARPGTTQSLGTTQPASTQTAPPRPAPTRTAPPQPARAPGAPVEPPRPEARPAAKSRGAALIDAAVGSAATEVDPASLDPGEFGILTPAKPRRRRPRRRLAESVLDMTPMIDVTFQLLIFFMFTNQLANPNPIEVPQAAYGRGIMPDGKQALLVDDQGRYYFGESTKDEHRAPSLEALVREVAEVAASRSGPLDVIISAHRDARHLHVRQLVEQLEKVANIGAIHLGVEEKQ